MEPDQILFEIVERGYIQSTSADLVIGFSRQWDVSIGRALTECHIVPELEFARWMSEILELRLIEGLALEQIDMEASQMIPFGVALEKEILVLHPDQESGKLALVSDPTDRETLETIQAYLGGHVDLGLAERSEIRRMVLQVYPMMSGSG